MSDNLHLAFANVSVLELYRRRGLATHLLPCLAEGAKAEGRRLLGFGTDEAVPAGEMLAVKLGAKRGMAVHTNQLNVADLDTRLLERWQADAPNATFDLDFWDGPFPEAELGAVSALIGVMNTAPREDLELEDFHLTPAQLRESERFQAALGTQRSPMCGSARVEPSRDIAKRPGTLTTRVSSVRAIPACDPPTGGAASASGSRLRYARVLREKPDIAYVRTGNADSNGPMLSIDHALEFKPRMAEIWWELGLDKLESYIEVRRAS